MDRHSHRAVPRAVERLARFGRTRGGDSDSRPTDLRTYGPPRYRVQTDRLRKLMEVRFPDLYKAILENEKEKEEEEEETRIPEKELEKLTVLKVKAVNFHMQGKKASNGQPGIPGNGEKHHTARYACTKVKDGQAVFRRGQEFKFTITFDRAYKPAKDDLSIFVAADEDSPGKGLAVDFKLDEERKKPFTSLPHWAARIMNMDASKFTLKLAIYIPATCAVAEWHLKVRTSHVGDPKKFDYKHPKPFVVLFNPWCSEDQVYYPGKKTDLDEYVMNESGTCYYGTTRSVNRRGWIYGQFQKDILEISLALLRQSFDFKISAGMADAVIVSRALSRIVNSIHDDGVLVGNWSGDFSGGSSPGAWSSSAVILRQFDHDGRPVKYGQCWVFSHVLTAVCRALGLPCRSVTNFDSAHDTDGSCTVDCYFDEEGEELKYKKKDSIWNFHVWNEVWLLRPDIVEHDCDGWHVIDATPQEQSDGTFQCGPCPIKAVKNGWVNIGYDTPFVFGEVNADVIHWMQRDKDGKYVPSKIATGEVGQRISTKPCDGNPHDDKLKYKNMDDPLYRMDVTGHYKYEEGSEEERRAVKLATGAGGGSRDIAKQLPHLFDLVVTFEDSGQTMFGQDLKLTAVVSNTTGEGKEAKMLVRCRTSSYWNGSDDDRTLLKVEPDRSITIPPKSKEKLEVTVPVSTYFGKVKYSSTVYVYAKATNTANDWPYTAQLPFYITPAPLHVEGPAKGKPKEVMEVRVTLTNPVKEPLTKCGLSMEGDLRPHKTDPNKFRDIFGFFNAKFRDLKPEETVTFTLKLYWEEEEEEEDEEEEAAGEEEGCEPEPKVKEVTKSQKLEFYCKEMATTGTMFNVTWVKV